MKASVLYSLIALTGTVFGAEIVASHLTQSLALLVSAYHLLYDILSLLLLVISRKMSTEKTLKNTFGWARVKVLGQLVNMLFLLALCFAAFVEAIQTMVHASHEDTEPQYPALMLLLGILNFLLNALCFFLIGGYTHHQGCSMIIQTFDVHMNCVVIDSTRNSIYPNGESVPPKICPTISEKRRNRCGDHQMLDFFRDASSGLTVVACGAILLLLDGLILKYADAILAMASVVVLLGTTYPFLRESGLILLQSIPSHIDVEGLTKRLTTEFPEVRNVHDLHVWRLTSSTVVATVHLLLVSPRAYIDAEARLVDFFGKEGISAVTLQPEFANESCIDNSKSDCILQCSDNNNCDAFTCCGPQTEKSKSQTRFRGSFNARNGVSSESSSEKHAFVDCDLNHIFSLTETTV